MDRSTVIQLVAASYQKDSYGIDRKTESLRDVFAAVSSVSASEWFEGGRNNLNPALRLTMFAPDYEGERVLIHNGTRYSVYRTYLGKNDTIDLYVQKEAGS